MGRTRRSNAREKRRMCASVRPIFVLDYGNDTTLTSTSYSGLSLLPRAIPVTASRAEEIGEDLRHALEVRVERHQTKAVLHRRRRDPNVVGGDRRARGA